MVSVLKKKLNNKKGFTLAELLIVVAILAILVAVAIRVFTASLSDAQTAVQNANFRAAKAQAAVQYLEANETETKCYNYTVDGNGNIELKENNDENPTEGATSQTEGIVKIIPST